MATTVGTSLAGPTTRKSEFVSVLTSPQKAQSRHIPTALRKEAEGRGGRELENDEVDPMMVHLLDEDGVEELPPDSDEETMVGEAPVEKEARKQRASVSLARLQVGGWWLTILSRIIR